MQNFFPKVCRGISVRVLRITCATRFTSAVRTLVKRHKTRCLSLQTRRHEYVVKVHRKVHQETIIQTETSFFRISIRAELSFCIFYVLPLVLVFEFQSDNGNAIDGKHHINRVVILCRISKLTGYPKNIACV